MRHTARKVFFAWSYEQEENWLNQMSAKGLQLVSVGFCKYVFEDGAPGEYNYRLELLENLPSHPESIAYIRFLEEAGIEQIGTYFRWVYFRRKATDGAFDLYSDLESRIKHYRRILMLLAAIMPLTIINAVNMIIHPWPSTWPLSLITSALAVLVGTGVVKMIKKIRRLTKEHTIRE